MALVVALGCTSEGTGPDGFWVTDGMYELRVDHKLHPGVSAGVGVADCVTLTGIESYREASMMPRSAADIESASGC
ncbi:MAG: hypothetical protein KC731_41230 [Myxococcales bacterium]|nr:hypothetical protein [Myxococcales bacterium]